MKEKSSGKVLLILSMFIFGTIGIFRRLIPLSSALIASFRGAVGALFIFLFALLTKKGISLKNCKEDLWKILVSGAFIGFNWILLFESYNYTTVSKATLCYYMAPVLVIIFSPIFLKEKITLRKSLAVIAAIIGMLLVSGVYNDNSKDSSPKGIIFGLAAALLYSLVVIINKKIKKAGTYERTFLQLGTASIVLLPYLFFTENFSEISFSTNTVLLLLFVGIVNTGVAYALYFASLKTVSAQSAAILSYVDPIVALIASFLILKEPMGAFEIIGAVLILGASFIAG